MGLQKTIETNHGVDATYWRVDCITCLSDRNRMAVVDMFGFPDKTASDEGRHPLKKIVVRITEDDFDSMVSNPATDARDWIYNAISSRNLATETQALQDQIDVIEMIPEGDRTEEQINDLVDLEYQKSALANDTIRYIFDGAVNVIEE